MTENDPAEQESKVPPTSFPALGEFKFKNDTSRKYRVFFNLGGSLALPAPPVATTPHEGDALLPQGLAKLTTPTQTGTVKVYVQDVTDNPLPHERWYMAEWQSTDPYAEGTDWIYAQGPPNDPWPLIVLPANGPPGTLVQGFMETTMPPGAEGE